MCERSRTGVSIYIGSIAAAGNQNLRVCFGDFLLNPKCKNFSLYSSKTTPEETLKTERSVSPFGQGRKTNSQGRPGIGETCIIAQRRPLKPTRSIRPVNSVKQNHKWVTTHANKWVIPTSQTCSSCDLTRTVDVEAAEKDSHYRWRYSDGTFSDQLPLGELWAMNRRTL